MVTGSGRPLSGSLRSVISSGLKLRPSTMFTPSVFTPWSSTM